MRISTTTPIARPRNARTCSAWSGRRPQPVLSFALLLIGLQLLLACPGCERYRPNWPNGPVKSQTTQPGSEERVYSAGAGSKAVYRQRLEDGRVVALSFDDNGDGTADETVDLLADHPDWPHFLIILDGVPFDVVQAMYDEGHFRLFPRPARVATVFPAMTDVAITKILHSPPCFGGEAAYFDRKKNRLSDGNSVYLNGQNAPWRPLVDYAAPQRVAISTYLNPPSVFSEELQEMEKLFSSTQKSRAIGYSVGTAGLGTRGGEPAIRSYLADVEKVCERITHDRRGRVRFSITADHGQTLQQCKLISLTDTLKKAGFRVRDSLGGPNDAVVVAYGLITSVAIYTDRASAVAEAVVSHPSVDLVAYREGDAVVIMNSKAKASVRAGKGGYSYDSSAGDPLELDGIIEGLRAAGQVSSDGVIADRPLLEATAAHRYPDPLHRLWDCFDGLIQNQAEVIVSLKPDACHGSRLFHAVVSPVASTHGGMDYLGSVTFLLCNARPKPLPAVLRVEDVLTTIDWAHADAPAAGK